MCTTPPTPYKDPISELARLLARELKVTVDDGRLRRLIRDHWSLASVLAHAVHREETSGVRKAARNVAALSEDGVLNVVEGRTESAELRADFLRLADAIRENRT
jgi:hypothetical protein